MSYTKYKNVKSRAEIEKKIIDGDIKLAGKMLGITAQNASKAYNRPGSKYHQDLLTALDKVITAREDLFKNRFN